MPPVRIAVGYVGGSALIVENEAWWFQRLSVSEFH
jgi:hypothetical protein